MKKAFREFVERHSLIAPSDRVLVCVSGGVDSMTLLNLMCDYVGVERIVVAHCNFRLRPGECDAETSMVVRHCEAMGLELKTVYFDTKAESLQSGESIQMTARRLRYDWFDEVAEECGCAKIAIAHNSGDTVETFFINLMRGTGLRGLTGIGLTRGRIIRPLLFASRDWIEYYAVQEGVEYKTDSSNLSTDYLRSRLRIDILPRFESSSSSFREMMGGNIERLSMAQRFVDSQIAVLGGELFDGDALDMERLREHSEWEFILYELLRPYGFSGEVISDISRASHSGKRFYSSSYFALLDRGSLIVRPRVSEVFEERLLDADDPSIEWFDVSDIKSLETPSHQALLCADSLEFPLRLRRWSQGDYFMPLGMPCHKKVSDFLIDSKVSLLDKERQGVLESGGDIIWLVGRRIDNRYRLRESSKRAILVTL